MKSVEEVKKDLRITKRCLVKAKKLNLELEREYWRGMMDALRWVLE